MYIQGPIFISSFIGIVYYYNKSKIDFFEYDLFQKLITFGLYGLWSLINTYRCLRLPSACTNEQNKTTLFYYKATVFLLLPFGLILGCILLMITLYLPYFFCQCYLAHRENTQDEREKRNMLNSLMSIDYDSDLFRNSIKDCSICSYAFQPN